MCKLSEIENIYYLLNSLKSYYLHIFIITQYKFWYTQMQLGTYRVLLFNIILCVLVSMKIVFI